MYCHCKKPGDVGPVFREDGDNNGRKIASKCCGICETFARHTIPVALIMRDAVNCKRHEESRRAVSTACSVEHTFIEDETNLEEDPAGGPTGPHLISSWATQAVSCVQLTEVRSVQYSVNGLQGQWIVLAHYHAWSILRFKYESTTFKQQD